MNYSTLKKTVGLSFVSLILVGMASAQTNTTSTATTKMSDSVTTAKVFGGVQQYNTLSVGVNVGVTAPFVATGGTNVFNGDKPQFGYGVSVRDQFSHAFSLRFDLNGGQVGGSGAYPATNPEATLKGANETVSVTSFNTAFWQGSISTVVNIGNIDFLQRKSLINFYGSAGFGIVAYAPTIYFPGASGNYGYSYDFKGTFGTSGTETYIHELVIPVGIGVKFKLSDKLDLNIGYNENFVDGYNFEGVKEKFPAKNKYSYGYGGLEYTFGPKSKPSLEWANPVAIMYDELYDAALRQEVQALKGRVKNVEAAIADLKKDSDGDGVSDQFDKCPNTPANSIVDGSGCPIVFPKPPVDTTTDESPEEVKKEEIKKAEATAVAYANIEFEFDSSVLKATSYPVLDLTIAEMKKSGRRITIAGYASSEGTSSYNMRLSKDRANSVKTYFLNSGVPSKQLKIVGYGETHPIADNSTEAGRILNRRVEFKK
jgi:OmpA-OmpF porin, OOP family